ncbi:MAG TPA: SpoIID/LytB domain-containing protein, partial [Ornithinibacter sp.]|nr:SpoIID/LytB domain-containing protein [Ornithinibacter sp.]
DPECIPQMPTTRWLRRALAVVLVVAAGGLAPSSATAAVPVLVLEGTGWGHGVGLSQWGAESLARAGRTTEEILGTFYPGVRLGEAQGTIRVAVHQPGASTTTLTFPQGGEVRSARSGPQADGFPVRVGPGGRVRITYDGAYRVAPLMSAQSTAAAVPFRQDPCSLVGVCPPTVPTTPSSTTTTAPAGGGGGPGTGGGGGGDRAGQTASSSAPVFAVAASGGVTRVDDRGRAYRGALEANGGGALRLVNLVDVEDYLRGMSEVPGTWPAAAVQAQTIAARTYALRAMQASGEICDDARCQVYVGATAESPGQDAAVAATTHRVITYGGTLAAAVYSADAGGVSANTFEGFGTPDGTYPYLRNIAYPTDNPLPWKVVVGLDEVARRLGYPGSLTAVRVAEAGPSARALSVALDGSAGRRTIDGRGFARALALRSTRFTARVGSADGAPPPPPPAEEPLQALPEEAATLARQPLGATADEIRLRQGLATGPTVELVGDLPRALDPRRHPASLAAILLAAFVLGALVPAAMAARGPGARTSARWTRPIRSP